MTEKSPEYTARHPLHWLDQWHSSEYLRAKASQTFGEPVTIQSYRIGGGRFQDYLLVDGHDYALDCRPMILGTRPFEYRICEAHRAEIREEWAEAEERAYRDFMDTQRDAAPLGM